MTPRQAMRFGQINDLQARLSNAWVYYWKHYSSLNTWHFWCLILLLVLPLVILYLRIDRTRALQIGFFGFGIHVWLSMLDQVAIANGLWNYRYTVIPYLNSSFVLDAAFTPILFMLVYQWTLNHHKNFYLYGTGLSCFLAFLFRPALSTFTFFSVKRPEYYLILCFILIVVMTISKWTTNVFVHFQNEGNVLSPKRRILEDDETPITRTRTDDNRVYRRFRKRRRI